MDKILSNIKAKVISIRAASKMYGITRITLMGRFRRTTNTTDSSETIDAINVADEPTTPLLG